MCFSIHNCVFSNAEEYLISDMYNCQKNYHVNSRLQVLSVIQTTFFYSFLGTITVFC